MSSTPTAIELRHLRYFQAVVGELHFGRAAEQQSVSQPAISKAIHQLEEELGVRLFERKATGVTLTEAGQAFADETRKILARVDLATAEARRAGGVPSTLRIGCLDFLPIERLQAFFETLREREPNLESSVTQCPSVEQIRRLRDGELDLGIFTYAGDHQEIETCPLFPGEPVEALLPSGHALANREALGPDDLREEELLSGPRAANPVLYDRFWATLDEAGYRFRGVEEVNTTSPRDLVLATAAGHRVMLRPISFRAIDEAGVNVVRARLDPGVTIPDTVVAWRSNPPRYLGRVLAVVREISREMRAATAGIDDS